MRLVWVVIPLVFVGFIGVQESFADTYSLNYQDRVIDIDYSITNATIKEITDSKSSKIGHNTLTIKIESHEDGILNIAVPRILLNSVGENCIDYALVASTYTHVIHPKEIETHSTFRVISIPFTSEDFEILIMTGIISEIDYVERDCMQIWKTLPLLQQVKNGVLPENITCKDGLELIFKLSNNSPACVKPQTTEKLIQRGWSEYQFDSTIQVEGSDVVLRYNIQNAILHSIHDVSDEGILRIELESSKQGTMTVEIPKNNSLCIDGEWLVLVDGRDTYFDEINNKKSSVITFDFPNDSKNIELIYSSIYKGMPQGCPILR